LERSAGGWASQRRLFIAGINDYWVTGFMSDALFDGQSFWILTLVDCHSRKSLAVALRTNFRAFQVVEILDRTARERRKPKTIRCDNDPEFSGRILDQ
jgi:putative transposase